MGLLDATLEGLTIQDDLFLGNHDLNANTWEGRQQGQSKAQRHSAVMLSLNFQI